MILQFFLCDVCDVVSNDTRIGTGARQVRLVQPLVPRRETTVQQYPGYLEQYSCV